MAKLEERLSAIRGVASDVDGTLRESGTFDLPSSRVTYAFKEWRNVRSGRGNFHDFVVTGSPYSKTDYLIHHLELTGPQVTSGGAEIIDAVSGKLIENHPINRGVVNDVCAQLSALVKQSRGRIHIQDNGEDFNPFSESYRPFNPYVIVVESITQELANDILRLFNTTDIHANQVILPPGQEHLAGIHLTHPLANKSYSVVRVSEIVDIPPKQFMGIGDGPNDRSLLLACGVGFALKDKNGKVSNQLQDIADFIVPGLGEDGAAVAIESLITSYKSSFWN